MQRIWSTALMKSPANMSEKKKKMEGKGRKILTRYLARMWPMLKCDQVTDTFTLSQAVNLYQHSYVMDTGQVGSSALVVKFTLCIIICLHQTND